MQNPIQKASLVSTSVAYRNCIEMATERNAYNGIHDCILSLVKNRKYSYQSVAQATCGKE